MGKQVGLYGHRVSDRGQLHASAVLWLLLSTGVDGDIHFYSQCSFILAPLTAEKMNPKLIQCQIWTLGLGCLVVSWFEKFRTSAWRPYRALMFVCLGVSGVVPVVHGVTIYSYKELNERMGLNWVLFQGLLYILGAFIYAVSVAVQSQNSLSNC